MRFLLFIPVFVLFLSNVPFIQKMPMEKMAAAMAAKKGCCKKKNMMKGSCQREPAAKPVPVAANSKPAKECGQPAATTCICICCFQFMAPTQETDAFQFDSYITSGNHTGYIQPAHKDPALSVPWQPPDFV